MNFFWQVLELRQWRLLAVGLDANPLLTATINAYGMVGASGEGYTGLAGIVF